MKVNLDRDFLGCWAFVCDVEVHLGTFIYRWLLFQIYDQHCLIDKVDQKISKV